MKLKCSKCKEDKPKTEFFKDRSLSRSYGYHCKKCRSGYQKEYNKKNRARFSERDKKYYQDNKAHKQKVHRKYRDANRIKRIAHKKVEVALLSGKLTRPKVCSQSKCRNKHVEAHHDDYRKPLEIRWLCRKCHARHHAKHGPGKT